MYIQECKLNTFFLKKMYEAEVSFYFFLNLMRKFFLKEEIYRKYKNVFIASIFKIILLNFFLKMKIQFHI